jgi:hypothetical protein
MRVKEKNRLPRTFHKNITERFEHSFKSGFFIDFNRENFSNNLGGLLNALDKPVFFIIIKLIINTHAPWVPGSIKRIQVI